VGNGKPHGPGMAEDLGLGKPPHPEAGDNNEDVDFTNACIQMQKKRNTAGVG